MQYGPWIKLAQPGKWPLWLKRGEMMRCKQGTSPCPSEGAEYDALNNTTKIQLPADHWAYAPIRAGYTPWAGGAEAPEDHARDREVLIRDGRTAYLREVPSNWQRGYGGNPDHMARLDIIGYHSTNGDPSIKTSDCDAIITELDNIEARSRKPWEQHDYDAAVRLLQAIYARNPTKRYAELIPLPTMAGVITQIDNLTAHMSWTKPTEWHGKLHIPTIEAATKAINATQYHTYVAARDAVRNLLLPPEPTKAERLYGEWSKLYPAETDMVVFAEWLLARETE